ncbi:MAG: tetratricopeptide repeat protein [Lysobacterales bacterium]
MGLSWAYEFQRRERVLPEEQAVALARDAAEKALAIDDNLGLGSVASTLGRLDRSIELLERAVTLDPPGLDGLLSLE